MRREWRARSRVGRSEGVSFGCGVWGRKRGGVEYTICGELFYERGLLDIWIGRHCEVYLLCGVVESNLDGIGTCGGGFPIRFSTFLYILPGGETISLQG